MAEQGHGDVAAIMIGAGTIGYGVFSRDGMYETYDPAIVGTIAIVLIAYLWQNRRTILQSVALAAVLGGCAVPVIGVLAILAYNPEEKGYCNGLPGSDCLLKKIEGKKPWNGSDADNQIGVLAWMFFGATAFFADRQYQRSKDGSC